jgi:hypothetical protein
MDRHISIRVLWHIRSTEQEKQTTLAYANPKPVLTKQKLLPNQRSNSNSEMLQKYK